MYITIYPSFKKANNKKRTKCRRLIRYNQVKIQQPQNFRQRRNYGEGQKRTVVKKFNGTSKAQRSDWTLKIPKNLQLMLKVRENYYEIAMLIENQRKNFLKT